MTTMGRTRNQQRLSSAIAVSPAWGIREVSRLSPRILIFEFRMTSRRIILGDAEVIRAPHSLAFRPRNGLRRHKGNLPEADLLLEAGLSTRSVIS